MRLVEAYVRFGRWIWVRFARDMKNIQVSLITDRQVALIIGAAIGAILIGMIGVSAHAGPRPILQLAGVHEVQARDGDEASGARTEENDSTGVGGTKSTGTLDSGRGPRPSATPSARR